jgi:hypothetical protein
MILLGWPVVGEYEFIQIRFWVCWLSILQLRYQFTFRQLRFGSGASAASVISSCLAALLETKAKPVFAVPVFSLVN